MRKPKGIKVRFTYNVPALEKPNSWTEYSVTRTLPAVPQRDDTVFLYESRLPFRLRVIDVQWSTLNPEYQTAAVEVFVAEFPTPTYEVPR